MSPQEIAALRKQGFSIQLHTHRHRLPDDAREIAREIGDNRSILGTLTDEALEHLCYPSGIWNAGQWPALTNVGVTSATTCLPGLNSPETPALALRRFLDVQDISADEFAAEMLGIKELYRRVRGVIQ
jgi:hypothetical protein